MSAPASSRVPSPRELVYRLATATGLTGPQVSATLAGEHVGHNALQRCVVAAERIGVTLPSAPRRPAGVMERLVAARAATAASRAAPEAEAPRPPRATSNVPRSPSPRRGRRNDRGGRSRHEISTNRDAPPPRGANGAA